MYYAYIYLFFFSTNIITFGHIQGPELHLLFNYIIYMTTTVNQAEWAGPAAAIGCSEKDSQECVSSGMKLISHDIV